MSADGKALPLSVVVLTHDEALNLPAFLAEVTGWAGEVFVVDSGSTDGTLDIAAAHGSRVVHHDFESHAKQWNWALRNLPFAFEWALCLDADHRVGAALRAEIGALLVEESGRGGGRGREASGIPGDVHGFYMKRRQIFRDRWIRHGGYYPKYLLKLVRHREARCDEGELADHRFYVRGGTRKLRSDVIEDNRNERDILEWTRKHVVYARRQAEEEFRRRRAASAWTVRPTLFGTPDQKALWLKRIWYRMPLYVRPFLYFAYRYIVRLGILDGKQGLVFHFLQGFWYRFLVDVVLDDLLRCEGDASAVVGEGSVRGGGAAGSTGHRRPDT